MDRGVRNHRVHRAGKRGRIISLRGEQMTHTDSLKEPIVLARAEVVCKDNIFIPTEQASCISSNSNECEITDLYTVGYKAKEAHITPFIHTIKIEGPQGEVVRIRGLFNKGALVNTMSSTVFEKVKMRLGPGTVSNQKLRMENGFVITSKAHWTGYVGLGSACAKIAFKVFNSRGNWAFLFGKPALEAFKAIHDYGNDTVTLMGIKGHAVVQGEVQQPYHVHIAKLAGVNLIWMSNNTSPNGSIQARAWTWQQHWHTMLPATTKHQQQNHKPTLQ